MLESEIAGRRSVAASGRPCIQHEPNSPQPAITRNASPLFPSPEARRRIDDWLTAALAQAALRVENGPVAETSDRAALCAALSAWQFETPNRLEDVLAWTIERMEHGIVHVNHPRYFGLFNPAPTFPSQCADRIAAIFNPQLATATTSPFPVELEAHVVRMVARRAGLPAASGGHFTTGGTEANYTALICALTHANSEFAQKGARAFGGQPVFYVSNEAHLAWLKIAHQAGIGRDAVRLISTDGSGRLSADALSECMAGDIANGHVPVMIAATAGTTGGGMIDPLPQCGQIARRHGIWYHVDAAWGGALIASDKLRGALDGIEVADSVTIDAHKWLATTMGCGMFLTARPAVLSAAFQVVMTCMPSNTADLDPYVTTVQWSRRFVGLRLFLALATAGWRGYAEHVERSIDLAATLANLLVARGWKQVNASPMAVLCMVPPGDDHDVRAIASAVVKSGIAWISAADFEGRPVVRACITSGESTHGDVALLADCLARLM
jgi:glutamate/tyrosine decarboxylase-like PLP-dependent enzyme